MEKGHHIRIAGFSGVFTLAPLQPNLADLYKGICRAACVRAGYARKRLARDCYARPAKMLRLLQLLRLKAAQGDPN